MKVFFYFLYRNKYHNLTTSELIIGRSYILQIDILNGCLFFGVFASETQALLLGFGFMMVRH